MKIGIFLEPDNINNKLIKKWKKIIKKNSKYQKYLIHPPHSTIAVFKFKKKINKKILKNMFNKFDQKKFTIRINRPSIFYNDPITNGDTLHFKIKKNINLITLQKKILDQFKSTNSLIEKKGKFREKILTVNLKKYGYPFVGKKWIPHFTIASITNKLNNKNLIIQKFLKQKITKKKIKINCFSMWLINGDKHIKMFNINLL